MSTAKGEDLRVATLVWDKSVDAAVAAPASPNSPTPPHPAEDDNKRSRVRVFVQLLEQFVNFAPNVRRLELPFDWSSRSVHILVRLARLETVTITSYYSYRAVDQALLSTVLTQLTRLNDLKLQLLTASGAGLCAYSFRSESVQLLDIASCHGLAVTDVSLPRLRTLRVSRRPWFGPLESGRDSVAANRGFPCLLEVLRTGAPNLQIINDLGLHADWRVECDAALQREMKEVCPCPMHYSAGV